jgi:endogenous inhibitor of DNA gyrase (YacG/DUF329 family)
MPEQRQCIACGKEYGNKPREKNYLRFCSSRCYERETYRAQFPSRTFDCPECETRVNTRDRRRVFCSKACYQKNSRKRIKVRQEYGLTLERYNEVMGSTDGRCSICDQQSERMTLDHCHDTGVIRGPLCTQCNTGLGMFRDNIKSLLRAVEYLKAHGKVARIA